MGRWRGLAWRGVVWCGVHTCGRVEVEPNPGPDEPCAYEEGADVEDVGE